jgi:hypothetical protein
MKQPASQDAWHSLYATYIGQIILSQDAWYQNATLQFYGETTEAQMEQILMGFLTSDAVKALPSTATEDDYHRLYMQYITSHLENVYQVSVATNVSPDTVAQSEILSTVFDLLAQMITTTSVAQIRDSQVMLYLTQKKNEYAKMLASVPLYTGTGTVDESTNDQLYKRELEGKVQTTNLNSLIDITIEEALRKGRLSLTILQKTDTDLINNIDPDPKLKQILQGLADQLSETGETVAYYDSSAYTDGDGNSVKFIIRVTLGSDGIYTVDWNTRSSDDGVSASGTDSMLTGWGNLGTFATESSTKQSSHPVEISSADDVYTSITFSTDPAKFCLGYGNITLQNLSDSLYSTYDSSTDKTASFTLYSGTWAEGSTSNDDPSFIEEYCRNRIVITVSENADGDPVVTTSLVQDSVPQYSSATAENRNEDGTVNMDGDDVTSTTITSKTVTLSSDSKTSITDAINSNFIAIWQAGEDDEVLGLSDTSQLSTYEQSCSSGYQTYSMNARDPKIAWEAGILGSAFSEGDIDEQNSNTVFTLHASSRAQYNQRLQSYLSAISGRMDALSNLNEQQQEVVNTSSSGQEATNNIITSMIQTMSQILGSIFK